MNVEKSTKNEKQIYKNEFLIKKHQTFLHLWFIHTLCQLFNFAAVCTTKENDILKFKMRSSLDFALYVSDRIER